MITILHTYGSGANIYLLQHRGQEVVKVTLVAERRSKSQGMLCLNDDMNKAALAKFAGIHHLLTIMRLNIRTKPTDPLWLHIDCDDSFRFTFSDPLIFKFSNCGTPFDFLPQ